MAQLIRGPSISSAGLLLAFFALSANGCGGTDEGRPTPPDASEREPVDPCVGHEDLEFLMIEDFESGVATGFNTGNDLNNTDNVDNQTIPFPVGSGPPAEALSGDGRCGVSRFALRYQAEGICQWASISANLDTMNDATEWEGIAVWVRQVPDSSVTQPLGRGIRIGVRDLYTVEAMGEDQAYCGSGRVEPAANRTTCPPSAPCPTPSEVGADHPERLCCDPFGLSVALTEDWHLWTVPFAEMQQGGYGRLRPEGLQIAELVRLELSLGAGNYDFWLDDIAFYRHRSAPSGDSRSN